MIAMAILSGALTWITVGVSRNIQAENHAKLMSTATFLARGKMVELEDELYEKGFGEFEKDAAGQFEDRGFARFTWKTIVDKIELPSQDQLQNVLTKCLGTRNAHNLVKATVDGLHRLRRPSDVAAMRGLSLEEMFGKRGTEHGA